MHRCRPSSIALFLLLATITTAALPAAASIGRDRIELVNGSVIIGTLVDADNGEVVIETDFAGTLHIDLERISAMQVQSALTLQMADGAILETEGLLVREQTLDLDERAEATYALPQLTRINPEPWELGHGYHHTGNASSAFAVQRGNTDLDEVDYRIDTRWTGLEDRFTLRLEGEARESNGKRTAQDWMITGKYDRFQVGDYYWGVAASAEENPFTDLNLRAKIGPYVGRSLFEDTPFVLEVESGLSQVSEDFDSEPDRDYVGLTWSLRSESDYLGTDSRLYLDHSGVKNLAERDNLILNTTLGLSFPLPGHFQGATEVVLNYNSGAADNAEDLDQTYRFRLGYSW